MNDDRARILAFLESHKLAVISTNNKSEAPSSALIAFTEDSGLCLYFQTGIHTRKAKNLALNPYVSLVIGLELNDMATLQYEGVAKHLTGKEEIATCKQRFLDKKSPTTLEYLERPDAMLFRVEPTLIYFSDYANSGHPTVIQLKDF